MRQSKQDLLINDVAELLAYAVRLERESVDRFAEFADTMQAMGEVELEGLFRRMQRYSQKHLDEMLARSQWHEIPEIAPSEFQWPGPDSPEVVDYAAGDPSAGIEDVVAAALEAERRGHRFYAGVAGATHDPEVRELAREFAAEEAEHVTEMQQWLDGLRRG